MKPQLTPLVVTLLATLATAQEPALQADWYQSPINGNWYGVDYTIRSWTDSEALAQSLGGHLATVRSQQEQGWIEATFLPYCDVGVWIGLNDAVVEGQFEWSSGEAFSYEHWDAGQPDNAYGTEDYVHMYGNDHPTAPFGFWNDLTDSGPTSAIERPLIEFPTQPHIGWSWPRFFDIGQRPLNGCLADLDGDGDLDYGG